MQQCPCKGNWGRDLAYAVSTALSIEDRRAWERDLVIYYIERLHAAAAPKIEFELAWRTYVPAY